MVVFYEYSLVVNGGFFMNILLAAWDDNRLIGNGNELPWHHIKEDMRMFRDRTLNHAVVMGRKTWESLKIKPLPGRENVVISKTLNFKSMPDGSVSHGNLYDALEIAHLAVEDKLDIFIIGGASVYKEVLEKDLVDKMIITRVHGSHEVVNGGIYFPSFDETKWNVKVLSNHELFDVLEYTEK